MGIRDSIGSVALHPARVMLILESSVLVTALPTVASAFDAGENYMWIITAYYLAGLASLPLYAMSAHYIGRKWLMVIALGLFGLGSGISGGATSLTMLLAGRAVQGLGGPGLSMLAEFTAFERTTEGKKDTGSLTGQLALVLGPFIGGSFVQHVTWRWVFYIQLPFACLGIILVSLLLAETEYAGANVDPLLNGTVLTASTAAILVALTYGGTQHPWISWHILVPLVLGLVGYFGTLILQLTWGARRSSNVARVLRSRDLAPSAVLCFLFSMLVTWVTYFLSVYFQAVLRLTPSRTGVIFLAFTASWGTFAVLGGLAIAFGHQYKPVQIAASALMTIVIGCFTLLNSHTHLAIYIVLEFFFAAGLGLAVITFYPSLLLPFTFLGRVYGAAAATYLTSLGSVMGFSVAAAIFNNHVGKLASNVKDPAVRTLLQHGNAYSHVSRDFVNSFQDPLRAQIVGIFSDSLRFSWFIAIAFAAFGLLVAVVGKGMKVDEHFLPEVDDLFNRGRKSRVTPQEQAAMDEEMVYRG